MRVSAIFAALFYAGIALADQNSAFQDGKNLGSSVNQSAFSGINSGSAADKVPAYGTNPSETQYYQGGQGQLSGPGVAKMQNCATATPDSDPIKRQECEAVNFLARNPQIRPQFNIGKNDPMILAAKHASNNAESFFQSLGINGGTGNSTQCTTRTDTQPAQYTTETCSSIKEVGEQQCTMGRTINIDSGANFQCDQTVNAYETLKCRRSSSVTCTGGGDGCDQGGIVPNSWAGDMATSFTPDGAGNYILQFGTIADNYWGGWGAVYDRNLTFDIRDVGLITRFALTRAAYDDWILIKVNGTTIYVGPYGGDRLEIDDGGPVTMPPGTFCYSGENGGYSCYRYTWDYHRVDVGSYAICYFDWDGNVSSCYERQPGMVRYGANAYGSPELSTSWNFGLNIDLRPYLRNGANTIFMRVIVAGGGEGAIQMTTRQTCPLNCSVSTDNQCAALEARAQ